MNRFILFSALCLFLSFSLQAQMKNPNDELKEKHGLTDFYLEKLCSFAYDGGYKTKDWPIAAMFELMIKIDSKIFQPGLSYESFETRQDFEAYIGKRWTEVYSCVECKGNGVTRSTLDGISLYFNNAPWVYELYSKEHNYNADINAIRVFDHILELKFTLYDFLVDLATVHPDRNIENDPFFKGVILDYAKKLKEIYGAKSMNELEKKN